MLFSLSRHNKTPARNTKHRTLASRKPYLEVLEDRRLLTTYTPIDFSVYHNLRIQNLQPECRDYPEGNVTLGGILFSIHPAGGANAWWGQNAPGGHGSINISVGVLGVYEVQTLINSSYGTPGPNSYASLEFFGSGGAYYKKDLIGNLDIRDHFNSAWTNQINNTTTTNVFTHGRCRLDKQFVALPVEFSNQSLVSIRVNDSGRGGFQNVILAGVTVGVGDKPDIAMLSAQLQTPTQVQFKFETTGKPGPFQVGLFQSADATLDANDRPVSLQTITPNPSGGEETGTFNLPISLLFDPARPLMLIVADPSNSIIESDDVGNNTQVVKLPDIQILDATTTDFRQFELTYSISGTNSPAFLFRAYLSTDSKFDPNIDLPFVGGQWEVSDDKYRSVNTAQEPYHKLPVGMPLGPSAPINANHRFIIVVADPGNAIPEGNEANNAWFTIPLIRLGNNIGSNGASISQPLAVGPLTAPIPHDQSNARFHSLWRIPGDDPGLGSYVDPIPRSSTVVWPGIFGFHDDPTTPQVEEPTAELKNEDHLIQRSLVAPFNYFVSLLSNDRDHFPRKWTGLQLLSINEAFDSTGGHASQSYHYDARAMDIQARGRDDVQSDSLQERLAGLAFLAGFDWSYHEAHSHIHISHRGEGSSENGEVLQDSASDKPDVAGKDTPHTVEFDQPIAVLKSLLSGVASWRGDPAEAFQLFKQDGSQAGLIVTPSVLAGKTVVVITFTGSEIIGRSLADGRYTLTIQADRIRDDLLQDLDGDANGLPGGNRVDAFFRLFGDGDGNGIVDEADFWPCIRAFGKRSGDPGYL